MRKMLDTVEERAPLKRNVTTDDVGGTAVYLASNLASGVSGQIIYVDSGIATMACV
jgi:enoyl-[acyl-carrier protein] reductase I